jgi:hypothetical protein
MYQHRLHYSTAHHITAQQAQWLSQPEQPQQLLHADNEGLLLCISGFGPYLPHFIFFDDVWIYLTTTTHILSYDESESECGKHTNYPKKASRLPDGSVG